ncbi:hypothetical protein ORJ66_21050 [Pseudoalteromonas tunicata]|uniref:hypothetical protein n=1 Tax=Pseudoalteromonas tunicata TaxID=314281 RepID=UPI00273EE0CF|nr:hypothetical protein [Pseudoalteromonas tunicata]MDP5215536.1 hypothetical protein [Pseudoalteromonas tunicata]
MNMNKNKNRNLTRSGEPVLFIKKSMMLIMDDGVTVKVTEVFYHPFKKFRVGTGLGEEKIGGAHPHTEDLYRLTASYDYHIGEFGLAPTIAVDFIDGHQAYFFCATLIRLRPF